MGAIQELKVIFFIFSPGRNWSRLKMFDMSEVQFKRLK